MDIKRTKAASPSPYSFKQDSSRLKISVPVPLSERFSFSYISALSASTKSLVENIVFPSLTPKTHSEAKLVNSLKYTKLAPITHFPDTEESKKKENRRNAIRKGISPVIVIKNSVSRCAFTSNKGSVCGTPKDHNQDSVIFSTKLNSVPYQFLFGVLDGHGDSGHEVSSLAKSCLISLIPSCPDTVYSESLKIYLENSVKSVANTVLKSEVDTELSGSTLCVALVSGNRLICANIGDSRCVLGRLEENWLAIQLTTDHKPESIFESLRIKVAGGLVGYTPDGTSKKRGPLRVWVPGEDVPGISMSRSIGDKIAKKIGVTSQCDLFSRKIDQNDKFIIIASDGIWDVIKNAEAVDLVASVWKTKKSEVACKLLADEARKRWSLEDSVDDISVVIVFFNAKE